MSAITNVSRRGFLTAAGGLALGLVLPERSKLVAQQFGGGVLPGAPAAMKPNAYIHIGTDDTVTFLITKSELGQGPMTSLSQILADELDCDWSKVRTEFAPVDTTLYGPIQGVVGSMSIRTLWNPLRRVGATGRAMLMDAAAQKWGVDKSQCRTENGFVINTSTNDRLSYGSLADAAANLPVPAECSAQGSQAVQADRYSGEAAGHARQSERPRAIWYRLSAAGNGLRRCGALPGVRWKGGQLRCGQNEGCAGRQERHSDFERRRRDCRQHLVGDARTPCA